MDPVSDRFGVRIEIEVHGPDGPPVATRQLKGQCSPAPEWSPVEDEGPVGVAHVPLGALFVGFVRSLLERVAKRQNSVLRAASLGAPAGAGQTQLECHIERRTIHAGLSARDDPERLRWLRQDPVTFDVFAGRTAFGYSHSSAGG